MICSFKRSYAFWAALVIPALLFVMMTEPVMAAMAEYESDEPCEEISPGVSDNRSVRQDRGTGIQDFPESYRTALEKLSKKHPDWCFERKDVDIDFSSAVDAQLEGNRSWIEGSADAAYVDSSDPKGGSWYGATRAGVEHFLDPRTYLDEDHIFAFESMTYDSAYQTADVVAKTLSSTFMSGRIEDDSITYADAFAQIGAGLDLNPLFLAARVKQEQGSAGKSDLISGKYSGYEGYYNYFNIQATGTGSQAVVNGLKFASTGSSYYRPWNTRFKSLKGGSQYIAEGYIKKGQSTLYFQKFNLVYQPYHSHQYMQNIRAPYSEAATMSKGYKSAGIQDESFKFVIPVLKKMPDVGDDPGPGGGSDSVKALTLSEAQLSLRTGERYRLVPVCEPAGCGLIPGKLTFTSSDPEAVSVDGRGMVTALTETEGVTVTVSLEQSSGTLLASCLVSASDCGITFYDAGGSVAASARASYGTRLSEIFFSDEGCFDKGPAGDTVSDDSLAGRVFAGWYTKPSGKGERLTWDYAIREDLEAYPFYADISPKGITILPVGDQIYTGDPIKPPVDVYYGGKRLEYGKDFKLSYKRNKNVGTADVVINGKKSFGDMAQTSFRILPARADHVCCSVSDTYYKYKGKAIWGKPVVSFGGRKLKKGRDYELVYEKSSSSGAFTGKGFYTIKVRLSGNVEGELLALEVITDRKMSDPLAKTVSLKGGAISGVSDIKYVLSGAVSYHRPGSFGVTAKNGKKLRQDLDYVVSYKNDAYPGSALMTIRGIGDYTGTIKKKYRILP